MKRVSILTPSDEPAWQAHVNSHSEATIYHALEWRDTLYNEYRFEPVYLLAKDNERVVGVFPLFLVKNLRGRRLVSLPFSIYGGPLGDTGEVVSALIEKSVEIVRNGTASSLEIRPHKAMGDYISLVSSEYGIGATIDLSVGIDGLWKRLTDRNDINRAIREGLNFRISDGEGIERFYRLQLMTRKRLGLPTPSLAYYRSFFERMPGMVKLALVEKGGIPIAGGIFFAYKGSILYALGASEQKYLYCRPNDMMIWEMMKWGCENGFKAFELGPTAISDKGLLHFKEKWGGEHRRISRFYFPSLPQAGKGSRVVNQLAAVVFKLLPESVASHVGYYAAKRMG